MASIKGIGGAFIHTEDVPALAAWYQDVLGIEMEHYEEAGAYFRVFHTRDPETSKMLNSPVFSIMPAKEKLAASGRGFELNLRVDDLHAFIAQLREKGVEIEKVEESEYGKFTWVHDPDGNRIELFEEPERAP
jgi:catechol 2,3-dioxygenase-like lactoylglutathione lyase family enzyme